MNKVFTIGYGNRKSEDFVSQLTKRGIDKIVDVRLRPDRARMGSYAKAKSPDKGIQRLLTLEGIDYYSFPELGNVFMDFEDWHKRYKELLSKAGDLLFSRLFKVPPPFCLLCAEKRAVECHRKIIAEYLKLIQ